MTRKTSAGETTSLSFAQLYARKRHCEDRLKWSVAVKVWLAVSSLLATLALSVERASSHDTQGEGREKAALPALSPPPPHPRVWRSGDGGEERCPGAAYGMELNPISTHTLLGPYTGMHPRVSETDATPQRTIIGRHFIMVVLQRHPADAEEEEEEESV